MQSPRFGLGLCTGSSETTVAIAQISEEFDGSATGLMLIDRQSWPLGKSLSSHGHFFVQKFMASYPWAQISWLAIATSGESLTGVRIGVVTARMIGQQCGIPVYGIPGVNEVEALLTVGYDRWRQGDRGDWAVVVPH